MIANSRRHCRGAALVILLVALALIGAVTTSLAWQMTTSHRLLEHREHELQAGWLARAGAEIAIARILASPHNYQSEAFEIVPHGEVQIAVQPMGNSPNEFALESKARYPTDSSVPVQRSITLWLQRVTDGGTTTIRIKSADK